MTTCADVRAWLTSSDDAEPPDALIEHVTACALCCGASLAMAVTPLEEDTHHG